MYRYVFVLSFLTSCTAFCPDPPVSAKPPLRLADPEVIRLKSVEFVVVHKDNAERVFSELEKSGREPVLFALPGSDYKNLSVNTIELRNYIKNQRKIIRLYRKYYEGETND